MSATTAPTLFRALVCILCGIGCSPRESGPGTGDLCTLSPSAPFPEMFNPLPYKIFIREAPWFVLKEVWTHTAGGLTSQCHGVHIWLWFHLKNPWISPISGEIPAPSVDTRQGDNKENACCSLNPQLKCTPTVCKPTVDGLMPKADDECAHSAEGALLFIICVF